MISFLFQKNNTVPSSFIDDPSPLHSICDGESCKITIKPVDNNKEYRQFSVEPNKSIDSLPDSFCKIKMEIEGDNYNFFSDLFTGEYDRNRIPKNIEYIGDFLNLPLLMKLRDDMWKQCGDEFLYFRQLRGFRKTDFYPLETYLTELWRNRDYMTLKWIVENDYDWDNNLFLEITQNKEVIADDISMINFFIENKPQEWEDETKHINKTGVSVINSNKTILIQFFFEELGVPLSFECFLEGIKQTRVSSAVLNEIVSYFPELNEIFYYRQRVKRKQVLKAGYENDNVEIVKWFHRQGEIFYNWEIYTLIEYKSYNCIEYILNNYENINVTSKHLIAATHDMICLKLLYKYHPNPISWEFATHAVYTQNPELLTFFLNDLKSHK